MSRIGTAIMISILLMFVIGFSVVLIDVAIRLHKLEEKIGKPPVVTCSIIQHPQYGASIDCDVPFEVEI